jgi:uncharacterized metal-binding protein YceD (DUF177 family)
MKHQRAYDIAWQGLKPGPHTFEYEIDERFMQERGAGEGFSGWKANVNLEFDKHESFFMLKFDIGGSVMVPCDRCGDEFELKLWDEFKLVVKVLGENAEPVEEEDDVIFIPRSETVLDVSEWLYEFVMLSIPIQRIHPETDGKPGCNTKVLSLLGSMQEATEHEPVSDKSIWKGLEAFKAQETKKKSIIAKKEKNK